MARGAKLRYLGVRAVVERCVLVALGLALGGCACAGSEAWLIDASDGGIQQELCVEVARTEAERMAGLRGRAPLEVDEGLILAFPVEDEICIVNDGVGFDIDAAFVGADGVITVIERGIASGDGTPRCHPRTRDVLETLAGQLADVTPGDQLRW